MKTNESPALPSRRTFLAGSLLAGGGLVLAVSPARQLFALRADQSPPAAFEPNAFLRIAPDGTITVIAKHDEMGQGIHTGLALAVCEELEVDVDRVEVVPAPADAAYAHAAFRLQVTGGSSSTWSSFEEMRRAGATARAMLIAAAAERWGVSAGDCVAKNGAVERRDGSERLDYGALANDAGRMPVPEGVALKDRKDFTRIGRPTARVDSAAKVRGTAVFSLDQRVPGMLTAMVERSPFFGGRVTSFDDRAARKVPGVKAVFEVPSGVAVIADGYWAAFKARRALGIEWEPGAGGALDSTRLRADYLEASGRPGLVAGSVGDTERALGSASRRIEATYEVPFQAHAPMEPLNCLVTLREDGGADLVTGSQLLGGDHAAVAARLDVDASKVTIRNSYLGGGFGRRANPVSDFVREAVEVALAARSLGAPIKTVWTREDDIRGGWYRPMFVNAMAAGIEDGRLVAWRHRIVGQSIAEGTVFEAMMVRDGVDVTSVEGAVELPYAVPNHQVELHTMSLPVPVQWWRSVGHSNTAFAKESFLDECAEAMGRDPYELRRELLGDHPRLRRALELVADRAGWSRPLAPGVGRGISVHESFQSFAAHVVEASVADGRPRIHRIVCAIDCGPVVNPDQVEAQMEGAAIFALASTLGSQITFADGRVEQSNFHDFEITRMHEAPKIEVHIVPSDDPMGGVGEVGVPGIASAVCSALHGATGRRIRRLPVGAAFA